MELRTLEGDNRGRGIELQGCGRRQRETEEWIQAYYFLGLTPYRGTDLILSYRMAEAMKERREAEDDTAGSRTIGKLAKEARVNVETIRFYERRGLLLRPKAPVSGWRVYDDSAVWVIHYIKLARQLGFTLAEVKRVMGGLGDGKSFCASVQKAYEDKIGLVGEKIHQLQAMRRELKKALAACLKRSATEDCPMAQRCSPQIAIPTEQMRMRR